MSLVFCPHKSESQCIAHIALMSAANPQFDYSYCHDEKAGWRTFWEDNSITKENPSDTEE